MNEVTAILDDGACSSSASRLSGVIVAYSLLLVFPVEYISRSSRIDFIKRGVVADGVFSRLTIDSDLPSHYLDQSLTIIRIFIKRVLSLVGYVEQPVSLTIFGTRLYSLCPIRRKGCITTWNTFLWLRTFVHNLVSPTFPSP
jgi:hypothetical protein